MAAMSPTRRALVQRVATVAALATGIAHAVAVLNADRLPSWALAVTAAPLFASVLTLVLAPTVLRRRDLDEDA